MLVVAAAIIRNDEVLVAQRSYPPQLRGRWEFPGGKVRPGERPEHALVRECAEELACAVNVGDQIGGAPLKDGRLLLFACNLEPGSPEPHAFEHEAIKWVKTGHLLNIGWLDSNRPLLQPLLTRLGVNIETR